MKITHCEVWPVTLTLEEPFTIAYSTTESTVNYFIRIDTDSGISGFGCSAYDEEVTGENEKSIGRALRDIAVPMLLGEDPLAHRDLLLRLYRAMPDQPTAMASVDMALFDILGKRADLPLYRLLGGKRTSILSSITIGIQGVSDTVRKAERWVDRGYRALKVKGGVSIEEDSEKLIRIREAVGSEIQIYFDANQGYREAEALECMQVLRRIGAEFIEQPCNKRDLTAFSHLTRQTDGAIRVMADEAVLGPEDALRVIEAGGADMFNIKLAKTGGILRATQLDAVASAYGARTMVGCMDEAGLGIAAALHVALACPNVQYADLDGHVEFIDDPSYHAVRIVDGRVYPNDVPGLGFTY